jgi:hypothetical protein
MNTEKLSHWVQIASGVALVVGLALVIIEMRQAKQLIRAQLAGESAGLALTRTLTLLGERPLSVLAKACDPDATMTREDALTLSLTFRAYLGTVIRALEVGTLGGFDDERWKQVANGNFAQIFATEHGRAWWAAVSGSANLAHDITDQGNKILSAMGSPTCFFGSEPILKADRPKTPM